MDFVFENSQPGCGISVSYLARAMGSGESPQGLSFYHNALLTCLQVLNPYPQDCFRIVRRSCHTVIQERARDIYESPKPLPSERSQSPAIGSTGSSQATEG